MLGRKLLKIADGSGSFRIEWTDMDFLIAAVDMEIDGNPVTPRRGDMVYMAQGGGTLAYAVMPYGSDPCWRWCDPGQSMMRVHTKLIYPSMSRIGLEGGGFMLFETGGFIFTEDMPS